MDAPGLFQGAMTKATFYTVNGPLALPENHPFLAHFTSL